jgi:hypothetical protein
MTLRLLQGRRVLIRAAIVLILAVAAASVAARLADDLGFWTTLLLVGGAAAAVSGFGIWLSMLAWARPIDPATLGSMWVRELLELEQDRQPHLRPRDVENALRTVLSLSLVQLADAEGTKLIVHNHLREDFDARVIDHHGVKGRQRISLLQVKARPTPSTFRLLESTMRHEGADRCVILTPRPQKMAPGLQERVVGTRKEPSTPGVEVVAIEDIGFAIGEEASFIELFTDTDLPMTISSVLVEH